MRPLVSVIICARNNQDIIADTIRSVKDSSYRNTEALLVDDDSTDETVRVARRFGWLRVIEKESQSGISVSRNLGIKQSKGKYVLFMDSDARINKDTIPCLVSVMESDKNIAVAGPKILFDSDHKLINSAGGDILRSGFGADRGFGEPDEGQYDAPSDCLFLCSAVTMVRRSVYRRIGLYDETIRSWGPDDVDFGWRANIAGYSVRYDPGCVGYHAHHTTINTMGSGGIVFEASRFRLRMVLKNYSLGSLLLYLPVTLFATFADVLMFNEHRRQKLRGIWWNFTHVRENLRARKRVQRSRKVPDRALSHLFISSHFTVMRRKLRSRRDAL